MEQAANDIVIILQKLPSSTPLSLKIDNPINNVLVDLATTLKQINPNLIPPIIVKLDESNFNISPATTSKMCQDKIYEEPKAVKINLKSMHEVKYRLYLPSKTTILLMALTLVQEYNSLLSTIIQPSVLTCGVTSCSKLGLRLNTMKIGNH